MKQATQMFQLVNYTDGDAKLPWIVDGNLIRFWRDPWRTLILFAVSIDQTIADALKKIEHRPRSSQSEGTNKLPISASEKRKLLDFLKRLVLEIESFSDELYISKTFRDETDQFEFYNSEYINMCNNLLMFLELSLQNGYELESWME